MVRAPCCEKMGLKKGPWTADEDQILISYIQQNGHSNWRALPKLAGLLRCGKSCRLRWTNYLRPDIKRGNFSKEEEDTVLDLHEKLGNRWSAIAAKLPGRTDNEIKNFWHTHLKKRLIKQNHNIPLENKSKKSKPQKLDYHHEFPSSSLDLSSLTDSSINYEDIGSFEAFHQTDGGLWAENIDVPILNSSAVIDEERVQSPLMIMDHMEFECYYDNIMKMDDSMEFWYQVFVKAGGSPNDPSF